MTNKLVTVVVPVYNMGKYLKRAIDCILKQTYQEYEVVIVDDGSSDGSSEICDEMLKLSDKIRVVHKENGGLSTARNAGIENAKGEFVIFPDPDDWTNEDYLQNLIDLNEKYLSDLEIGGHYVSDDNGNKMHNAGATESVYEPSEALEMLMSPKYFCGFAWNKLYHLDIINANSLRFDPELGMAQDLHFAFRYFTYCKKIAYNPAPTYYYFQHVGGVTNAKSPLTKRKISGLKTYEKIAEIAKGKYPSAENQAYATIFNMSMHFCYIYYASKMKDKELLKKLKGNLKAYKSYFLNNENYSKSHKTLGKIALISPRAYYLTKKLLKG